MDDRYHVRYHGHGIYLVVDTHEHMRPVRSYPGGKVAATTTAQRLNRITTRMIADGLDPDAFDDDETLAMYDDE